MGGSVAALTGGGAVGYCDFVDRSTVTAARAKPPTAKTAVSGATYSLPAKPGQPVSKLVALYIATLLQRQAPNSGHRSGSSRLRPPHGTPTGQNHICERTQTEITDNQHLATMSNVVPLLNPIRVDETHAQISPNAWMEWPAHATTMYRKPGGRFWDKRVVLGNVVVQQ